MRLTSRLFTQLSRVAEHQRQTVYLTHVKWVTGKQHVEKYFSRFGKVEDVTMFFVSFN